MSVHAGRPILGAFARTERGKQILTAEALHSWVHPWMDEPDPTTWWIDSDAGCAFFLPEVAIDDDRADRRAVLSIRGSVHAGGREKAPSAWHWLKQASGAASILYDVLERDAAAIRSLRGQFALACWDGRRRRLTLARDHLGQRGMFTHVGADLFVFCSELAPLLRAIGTACELDRESAFWHLAFGMSAPGRTLARGVGRLPAAHVLVWEPSNPPLIQRYWTPLSTESPRAATPDVVEMLRDSLDRSIACQLSADSPQGIFLSGGVDSTYIATTAKAISGGGQLYAFTSTFEEKHGMNETEYAAAVAEWLGIKHEVVPLHVRGALELLEDVILPAAEPCSAWASITHFWLLVSAREKGVTRMLSGLGADEIFGGYDHFRGYYARYLRYRQRYAVPAGIDDYEQVLLPENRLARRVFYPGVARFFDDPSLQRGLHEPYCRWDYASHLRSFYRECRRLKPEAAIMEMMVAHECQYRIPDLLFANFESISRRVGVEISYPFLDPDLVSLASGLEVESRYRTRSGKFSLRLKELLPRFKYVLMLMAEDRVPDAIRNRPRKSFTAPFGAWLFDERFAVPLLARLRASRLWDLNIIRRDWLDHVLARVVPGPNPWVFQLWAMMTLAGWYDHFVDRR